MKDKRIDSFGALHDAIQEYGKKTILFRGVKDVQRERMICKFWIQPVALARNQGFTAKELNIIREIITRNRDQIMEAWYEHFGTNAGSEN